MLSMSTNVYCLTYISEKFVEKYQQRSKTKQDPKHKIFTSPVQEEGLLFLPSDIKSTITVK